MVQKQSKKQVKQKKQVKKVPEKKNESSTKYLYLFIVIVVFSFAFGLLINKQNDNYLNDLKENNLGVTPELGKVIVARDMNAIYPKYYVIYTDDNEYSIYVYNYYETSSQYELEYNRLISDIVDYNAKDKMIRYIYDRGYGTYNEVLNNLSALVNSDNLYIY